MTVIELSDEQAAALTAKAKAQGLSLETWFNNLASDAPAAAGVRSAADIVLEDMRTVQDEVASISPTDGASEHDRYLYSWAKQE